MKQSRFVPYLYLLPALMMFASFIIYPLGDSFYLSFTKYSLVSSKRPLFIGFENYLSLLTKNTTFLTSMTNQVKYGIPFFFMGLIISFFIAVLINTLKKGKSFFQIVLYMPLIIPNALAAIIFLWLFDHSFGIINYILRLVKIVPPLWFNDSKLTIFMFAPINLWITVGFPTMIFINGLQVIPVSLYEASTIDGANFMQKIRFITIPLLKNYIVMVSVWLLINSLKLFDLPYILTGGGPGVSTYTMYFFSWSEAFQIFKLGTASAAAFINGIIILLLCWAINRFTQEKSVNR